MDKRVCIAFNKIHKGAMNLGISNYYSFDNAIAELLSSHLRSRGVFVTYYIIDGLEITAFPEVFDLLIVFAFSSSFLASVKEAVVQFKNCNSSGRVVVIYSQESEFMPFRDIQDFFELESDLIYFELSGSSAIENCTQFIENCLKQKDTGLSQKSKMVMRSIMLRLPIRDNRKCLLQRPWIDRMLNNWIYNSKKRICWIEGAHGTGKTYYIDDYYSRLKESNPKIGAGAFFCKSSENNTQRAESLILSIAHVLCGYIPGYAETIDEIVLNSDIAGYDMQYLIRTLLLDPFEQRDLVPCDFQLIYIIDGIDEIKSHDDSNGFNSNNSFLSFLFQSLSLHTFFRFIVTSVPDNIIRRKMSLLKAYHVCLDSDNNQTNIKKDAESFLCIGLKERGIRFSESDIQRVLDASDYNFDYLSYFLEQYDDKYESMLLPLNDLPHGLNDLYLSDFEQKFTLNYYRDKIKPLFQVLSVAYEPLAAGDLSQILGQDINEINQTLSGDVAQFLKTQSNDNHERYVSLYTVAFEKWLKMADHAFSIDVSVGRQAIVDWIKSESSSNPYWNSFFSNGYITNYGLQHLSAVSDYEPIIELIMNSHPDNREKLKRILGRFFIQEYEEHRSWIEGIMNSFKASYKPEIRDCIVYLYRYILNRKSQSIHSLQDVLSSMIELLTLKGDIVRAELLQGEAIVDYSEAKKHFEGAINHAVSLTKQNQNNKWWSLRMCGVAYNRLANLEKKKGDIGQAIKLYKEGKSYFKKAKEVFDKEDNSVKKEFEADHRIIERDLGISNERLGDLSLKQGNAENALKYYRIYYDICKSSYERSAPSLRVKWDYSISILRIGDTLRVLKRFKDAQYRYKRALEIRRDILQYIQSENMKALPTPYYLEFCCCDCSDNYDDGVVGMDLPQESRDIEPVRDIAMCYIRLGDLAYTIKDYNAAEWYFRTYKKLCVLFDDELHTASSARDLNAAEQRLKLMANISDKKS